MGKNIFEPTAPVHNILKARFQAINVPESIKSSILNDIIRWYRCNGKEWTVERLKFLHQAIKKYCTNENFRVPQGVDPKGKPYPWVKLSKDKLLADHWGGLMHYAKQSPKCLQECGKITRSYTVFSKDVTTQDVEDWVDMVQKPYQGETLEPYFDLIDRNMPNIYRYIPKSLLMDLVPQQEAFIFKGEMKSHHEKSFRQDLANLFCDELNRNLWSEERYAMYTAPFIGASLNFAELEKSAQPYNGEINVIIEPGMKVRYTLNFNKAMEHILDPLSDRIYSIIEKLPWEATHDEFHGYREIQLAMKRSEGKQKMYCFDMSNATDRFPLALQIHCLRRVFDGCRVANDLIDIFEAFIDLKSKVDIRPKFKNKGKTSKVSSNSNVIPKTCNNSQTTTEDESIYSGEVRWVVGQPMGARPSFAMFSLTHGLVCMALLKGQPYKGQFVVHGDDLVIMDDQLAIDYQRFCSWIDQYLNDFKALESYTAAEINSKLIFANTIVEMRKWKPIDMSNVLDSFHYWGPKVLDWAGFNSEEKYILKEFLLPFPGILPGYRGWNPLGKSLEERSSWFPNHLLDKSPRRVDYGIVTDTVVKGRLDMLIPNYPEGIDEDVVLQQVHLTSTILNCLKDAEQVSINNLGEVIFTTLAKNSLANHPASIFGNLSEITSMVRSRFPDYTMSGVPRLRRAVKNISVNHRPKQLINAFRSIVTP